MQFAVAFAVVSLLTVLSRRKRWRETPFFTLFLLLDLPLILSYKPTTNEWWNLFQYYDPLLLLARTAVTVEAILLAVIGCSRVFLRSVLTVIVIVGMTANIAVWFARDHFEWLSTAVDLRTAHYTQLDVICIVMLTALWKWPSRAPRKNLTHLVLWSVWVTSKAIPAMLYQTGFFLRPDGKIEWPSWSLSDQFIEVVPVILITAWCISFLTPERQEDSDHRPLPDLPAPEQDLDYPWRVD